MWKHDIMKFSPESSYFSCRATFHICIVYEHSFQCVFHMWHFDTGNNVTEWMTIYCTSWVQ